MLRQSLSPQGGSFDGPSGMFDFNCLTICLHWKNVIGINWNLVFFPDCTINKFLTESSYST